MSKSILNTAIAVLLFPILGAAPVRAADDYTLDAMHSGVTFKISHAGLSWTYGRFKDLSGSFTVDKENPGKSSFEMTIKVESIDTNSQKRDDHLRSPDFFNAKQFPLITFKSTTIKPIEGGLEVNGDFTLHGVAKPLTFSLKGGRTAELPKGVQRTGYTTELILKRSDFGIGMDKFKGMLGDKVFISISFEGVKK